MHRTLFALTLALYLLAPAGPLARFCDLAATLEKEGPGLDPDGAKVPSHAIEEGPGLDPNGRS